MIKNLSFDSPVTYLLIAGLVGWAIARQLQPRRVSPRSLLLIPAAGLYFTVQQAPQLAGLDLVGWSFLALSGAVGAAAGVARALTMRTWIAADGAAWMQGTWPTMAIWGAMIAFRIGAGVAGHFAGVPTTAMMGEIVLMLTLTFGAQNAVIWLRTLQPVPVR